MISEKELEKKIDSELKKLDPDLYLDKLWDSQHSYAYHAVRYNIGSGVEPFTSVEWKDADGPIPLSYTIIDFVKRNEGDITEDLAKVKAHNAAKKELAKIQMQQDMEDAMRDFAKLEKTDYWRSLPREHRMRNKKLRNR